MKIPKINKLHSALEGFPPPPDGVPPLNQFYIGEDVFLSGYLSVEDIPVSILDWEPNVIVKTNAFTTELIWEGTKNNGFYMSPNTPGKYEVIIPSTIFENKAPGTYWLEIFLTEVIGRFNGLRDRKVLAARIPFSMDMAGISPSFKDSRRDAERTVPSSINIMHV